MLIYVLMMFGIFLFLGVTMAMTPYISRKEILFGVSLPKEMVEHTEIKKMKQKYAIYSIVLSVLFSSPIFVFLYSDKGEYELAKYLGIYVIVAMLLYMVATYLIYYAFHKRMQAIKEKIPRHMEREAQPAIVVFTDFRHKSLIVSNRLFITINLVITLVTILIPVFMFDRIPDQVPVHWGLYQADSFAEKSLGLFATMPLIQLAMMLVMAYANYSLKEAKQKISPDKPKISLEQNRAYRYAMSKMTVTIGIGVALLFLLIQCFMVFAIQESIHFIIITIIFLVLVLGGTLYIAVKYGQGGERYTPREEQEILQRNEAVDDDKYWKLGLIYYNPTDPAIWVEKRFGMGVTLNMGRWQAWGLILGLVVITIIITIIPLLLGF